MKDLLVGMVKLFVNVLEQLVGGEFNKKSIIGIFIILAIIIAIVFYLTKDF